MAMDTRPLVLSQGGHEIRIDLDAGARATSWRIGGVEVLTRVGEDPVEHGMYPMAPWAGRVRGNEVRWKDSVHPLPVSYGPWALHGTCLAQRARVVEVEEGAARSRVTARLEEHPAWPWPMAVDVTWDLGTDDLRTSISVHALKQEFPAVVGWHPWFRRCLDGSSTAQWGALATERLVRGDDHLPTGDRVGFLAGDGPFDDALVVPDGRGWIAWPGGPTIEIDSTATWFVVYDERPDAVCIEPQSGPPDGLDGSHGMAAPGRPLSLSVTWRVRQADRG